MIRFTYKILPVFIFKAPISHQYAITLFNIIVISEDEFKDGIPESLIVHEMVHIKQFYRTLGLATILYNLSAKMRYTYELEAYREQISYQKLNNSQIYRIATILKEEYRLDRLRLELSQIYKELVH